MAGTGFEPVGFVGNRQFTGSMSKYWIASGATNKICYGQPVVIDTTGTVIAQVVTPVIGTHRIAGIFLGCSYIDGTGNRTFSLKWPAAQSSVGAYAYVTDARDTVFRAKILNGSGVDATTTIASIGSNCAIDVTNLELGTSGRCGMGVSGIATTNSLPLRILGLTNSNIAVADSTGVTALTEPNPDFITTTGTTFTHALVTWTFGIHHLDLPLGI